MQKTYSLKKNAQFKYVHRRGKSSGSHELVLLYVPGKTLKIGFTVGKKVGGAVVRNRVKRRLREACRPLLPRMKRGLYVFIAREPAGQADYPRLARALQNTLTRQNLLSPELPGQAGGREP